jgi:phage-related protein
VYHIVSDAVVILDVFKKQTEATPTSVISSCQRRLREYQRLSRTKKDADHA